ncbi:hypothetical protein BDV93DRAFT_586005 [Ceratobasidium sp. AG-I]|nr:hypothetical protein BDV93DRAFT_586005 [Ceratobasidium sp. AG-I]
MSWYRNLLGVVIWIVMFASILPVSPMANLASPPPSSLARDTATDSSESVWQSHPAGSLAYAVEMDNSTKYPWVKGWVDWHVGGCCWRGVGLMEGLVTWQSHLTWDTNRWQCPWNHDLMDLIWVPHGLQDFINPVLDTIVHPSTTPTGKADVAPTSTWTISNPAQPQVAPGLSRGRSYAHGFKSRSTSSAFPSIFDVGKNIRGWIASAGVRLLLAIENMVDRADCGLQQVVSFSLDLFAGSVAMLFDSTNWMLSILNNLPRTPGELLSTWNSFIGNVIVLASQALSTTEVIIKESPRWSAICFASGRKIVVDNWPASERLLSTVKALPSTSYSVARRTASNALAAIGAPPQGHPSWSTACTWILKRYFVSFHLPALVIFWASWAVYTLFHRYGPSFEWRLLPLIGFDPRLFSRQIRRMTHPRFWNVQDLVMYFLVQRARQAEASRRRRYEPAPSESEGSEWEFEDDGPFITNGEASSPFDVPAWAAEVKPAVDSTTPGSNRAADPSTAGVGGSGPLVVPDGGQSVELVEQKSRAWLSLTLDLERFNILPPTQHRLPPIPSLDSVSSV